MCGNRAVAESLHLDPQVQGRKKEILGIALLFETSKSTTNETLPLASPHLLKPPPEQLHQVEKKCSNMQVSGGHFTSKPQQSIRGTISHAVLPSC